jgi:monovalent cation:H+ antiporter-2, CPA2 family
VEGASEALNAAWIKDVFIFLGAAGIVVPIFHRARIGAVFGFLVVGLIVGPFGLGRLEWNYPWVEYLTIDDPERVEPFAELGVIFLLFLLGLELSIARLWQMRRNLLGVGALQVGLSGLAIGVASVFAGAGYEIAIVLGLCLALSSTAIVMELMREQNRVATPLGRLALAVLLFQDLTVVPILFVTGVLGRGIEDGILVPLLIALGQAAIAIFVILVAGRFVARPLLRFVVATGSRDLIMAVTVLIVVTAAGATGAAGLSTALGAFLAGLLLSETEYRHEIEVDLDPFKGLLLGLFFVTVGMTIDVLQIAAHIFSIVAAVVGLLTIKALVLFGIARAFGVTRGTALESSLLLAQAGEFALVVITLARGDGLLGPELAQFVTAVVGITMILTPGLAFLARKLGAIGGDRESAADAAPDAGDTDVQAIIVGFGRVGRTVARVLEREQITYIALDTDGALVARERKKGKPIYFGDGRHKAILEHAGIAHADSVVATLADGEGTEHLIMLCAKHWPHLALFARAKDREHAARLTARGATVVPETVEPSLQLAARVLDQLGFSDGRITQTLAAVREAELGEQVAYEAASRKPKRRGTRKRGRKT